MTAAQCTLLLGLINWQGSQVLPGGSGLHQALNLPANVRRGRDLLMGAPPSWKASLDNLGGDCGTPTQSRGSLGNNKWLPRRLGLFHCRTSVE